MWRIEISCKRFFRLRINLFNDTIFLPKIYFWTNILLPFKAIWEERGKRGLMSYLSAWGRGPRLSLKINAQPGKPDLFTKNGKVGTDDFTTHGSVAVPVGRDRKIRTALSTHHIAGFVTVPSEKKINTSYTSWLQSNFSQPWRGEKKYEQWANFRPYFMLKHRIRNILFHYHFQVLVF